MATIQLPKDFKEFLLLLNQYEVEYLLVGGFAVGYYGFPRATLDIDFFISFKKHNIDKVKIVLREFGFDFPEIDDDNFWEFGKIIRMGNPPVRIELISQASGVEFDDCYNDRLEGEIDGIKINIISLADLKKNKLSAGRHKDLNDIENLS